MKTLLTLCIVTAGLAGFAATGANAQEALPATARINATVIVERSHRHHRPYHQRFVRHHRHHDTVVIHHER